MIGWLLLTAFVAEPAQANDAPVVEPPAQTLKIDILVKQPAEKCEAQSTDEIVVCAEKTDNESQRLRPIANAHIYDKDESRAEFGISENVRMAAEVDSNQLGGGVTSKSIMARVKIKF
jgi:hypothetical protein